MRVDWHAGPLTRDTPVTADYRSTQAVRRFFIAECGPAFTLDRAFRSWLLDGTPKTLGDAADRWSRGYARPVTAPRP